jgi:hypothetical protein
VSYRHVTFEAEIDVERLLDSMADAAAVETAKQAVQDAIGHTGAVVTEILFVGTSKRLG